MAYNRNLFLPALEARESKPLEAPIRCQICFVVRALFLVYRYLLIVFSYNKERSSLFCTLKSTNLIMRPPTLDLLEAPTPDPLTLRLGPLSVNLGETGTFRLQHCYAAIHGVIKSWTGLSDRTTTGIQTIALL